MITNDWMSPGDFTTVVSTLRASASLHLYNLLSRVTVSLIIKAQGAVAGGLDVKEVKLHSENEERRQMRTLIMNWSQGEERISEKKELTVREEADVELGKNRERKLRKEWWSKQEACVEGDFIEYKLVISKGVRHSGRKIGRSKTKLDFFLMAAITVYED